MTNQEDIIMDKFFKHRESLIDEYTDSYMSKTTFIEKNYSFIMALEFSPFDQMNDFKHCIYNYQYYNILAKYMNLQAQELEFYDPKGAEEHKVKEFEYYALKDRATLRLLECVEYKQVSAYFLNLSSNRLSGSLYEIVFHDYDKAIFHSMDQKILSLLRANGVFSPVYKDSVIHAYVNSVY